MSPVRRDDPNNVREPKLSLEERVARAERTYCNELMRRLVEYELDPAHFTQEMRDRKQSKSHGP